MPAPAKVIVKGSAYTVPILTGEMDDVVNQINSCKNEIQSLNEHLNGQLNNLKNLNQQLMTLYIQQTGQFPPVTNT